MSAEPPAALPVERRQELEQRIRVIVERGALEWQQTFDAIASAVLVLDRQGVVRRLNRAAKDLAGRSFQESVGAPVRTLAAGEPWREAGRLAALVGAGQRSADGQARDETSGRTWDVEASWLPAADQAEPDRVESDRVIVVARDVTRVMELQESLRHRETLVALGSLLAAVAHEVRNPLFGITATLDAMRARYRGTEGFERYFDVLRQELQRLKSVMSDLLDFGRPPAVDLRLEPIDGVLEEAVAQCAQLARERGVEVVLRPAPRLVRVLMDRARLIRLFRNLIENAIFHSGAGATVDVEARRPSRGGTARTRLVECRVLDRGTGFEAADLGRIFEPFFTRRREGIGLGLAIARRIAEDHGGLITARNRDGGGAELLVELPRGGDSGEWPVLMSPLPRERPR
jgi:PAS domain S-box-containing protein